MMIAAEVSHPVTLDASASHDPDRGQTLHYHWFHYAEAGSTGTNMSQVTIIGADTAKAIITPTTVCRDAWMPLPPAMWKCSGSGTAHIILAVTDDGSPQLTTYRRIILTVNQSGKSPAE